MDVAAPYLAACLGAIFKGGEKLVDATEPPRGTTATTTHPASKRHTKPSESG